MATWHTDYLLGNDTTGNGSAALPYKTIGKAFSVAAANDTVKVAGSTLSDVPGLTLTSQGGSSFIFTANIDPTGLIAAGDVLSLTDPLWGADKFFFRVVSISGLNVTLSSPSLPNVAMSVRKFNQIHYATSTTGTIFESGTQPNNIQLLGGWNSDFTLQNGWTVARFQNASVNSTSGVFLNIGSNGNLTYRERFAIFNMTTAFPGSINEEYWGDMIFVRVANTMGSVPLTNRNDVKWYFIWSNPQSGITTRYNNNGTFGLSINEFYTIKMNTANTGISTLAFNCDTQYAQSSATATDVTTTNVGLFPSTIGGSMGDIYLNQTVNADVYIRLAPAGNGATYRWNGRLFLPGFPVVLQTYVFSTTIWNNPTQNITADFRWWFAATNTPSWATQGTIYAYDSEGTKVCINGNGFQYVDTSTYVTGTNSLRNTRPQRPTTSGQAGNSTIGQFIVNSATTRIDITITAKNDSASNITETFRLWTVGFLAINAIPSDSTTRSLNNTWTTWTWTITDATTISRLKNTLVIISWISTLNANLNAKYLWIDDITITQS